MRGGCIYVIYPITYQLSSVPYLFINTRFFKIYYLTTVCGMFVCVSLSVNVCMFNVSNALLMSNATAIVRVGGMG